MLGITTFINPSLALAGEDQAQLLTSDVSYWIESQLISRYPHAISIDASVKLPRSVTSLPICETAIALDAKSVDVGRTRVTASCHSPAWSTRATVNASLITEAIVSVQSLKKGHRIQAGDFQSTQITLSTPQKPYYFDSDLEGKKLKRAVRSGELITFKHIEHDYAVHKGDNVNLNFAASTFTISTEGVALESGMVGDQIKVRNKESGKLLRGTVTSKQSVDMH